MVSNRIVDILTYDENLTIAVDAYFAAIAAVELEENPNANITYHPTEVHREDTGNAVLFRISNLELTQSLLEILAREDSEFEIRDAKNGNTIYTFHKPR